MYSPGFWYYRPACIHTCTLLFCSGWLFTEIWSCITGQNNTRDPGALLWNTEYKINYQSFSTAFSHILLNVTRLTNNWLWDIGASEGKLKSYEGKCRKPVRITAVRKYCDIYIQNHNVNMSMYIWKQCTPAGIWIFADHGINRLQ